MASTTGRVTWQLAAAVRRARIVTEATVSDRSTVTRQAARCLTDQSTAPRLTGWDVAEVALLVPGSRQPVFLWTAITQWIALVGPDHASAALQGRPGAVIAGVARRCRHIYPAVLHVVAAAAVRSVWDPTETQAPAAGLRQVAETLGCFAELAQPVPDSLRAAAAHRVLRCAREGVLIQKIREANAVAFTLLDPKPGRKIDRRRERDPESDRRRERDPESDRRRERDPESDRGRERDPESDRRRGRECDREQNRDRGCDRDREHAPESDRGRDPERDRVCDRDTERDSERDRECDRGRECYREHAPERDRGRDHNPDRDRECDSRRDRESDREHNRESDREHARGRERESDREHARGRERESDREHDRDREHARDRDRESDREHARGRERESDREHDRDREHACGRERESDREHDRDREHARDRDRESDREHDRDREGAAIRRYVERSVGELLAKNAHGCSLPDLARLCETFAAGRGPSAVFATVAAEVAARAARWDPAAAQLQQEQQLRRQRQLQLQQRQLQRSNPRFASASSPQQQQQNGPHFASASNSHQQQQQQQNNPRFASAGNGRQQQNNPRFVPAGESPQQQAFQQPPGGGLDEFGEWIAYGPRLLNAFARASEKAAGADVGHAVLHMLASRAPAPPPGEGGRGGSAGNVHRGSSERGEDAQPPPSSPHGRPGYEALPADGLRNVLVAAAQLSVRPVRLAGTPPATAAAAAAADPRSLLLPASRADAGRARFLGNFYTILAARFCHLTFAPPGGAGRSQMGSRASKSEEHSNASKPGGGGCGPRAKQASSFASGQRPRADHVVWVIRAVCEAPPEVDLARLPRVVASLLTRLGRSMDAAAGAAGFAQVSVAAAAVAALAAQPPARGARRRPPAPLSAGEAGWLRAAAAPVEPPVAKQWRVILASFGAAAATEATGGSAEGASPAGAGRAAAEEVAEAFTALVAGVLGRGGYPARSASPPAVFREVAQVLSACAWLGAFGRCAAVERWRRATRAVLLELGDAPPQGAGGSSFPGSRPGSIPVSFPAGGCREPSTLHRGNGASKTERCGVAGKPGGEEEGSVGYSRSKQPAAASPSDAARIRSDDGGQPDRSREGRVDHQPDEARELGGENEGGEGNVPAQVGTRKAARRKGGVDGGAAGEGGAGAGGEPERGMDLTALRRALSQAVAVLPALHAEDIAGFMHGVCAGTESPPPPLLVRLFLGRSGVKDPFSVARSLGELRPCPPAVLEHFAALLCRFRWRPRPVLFDGVRALGLFVEARHLPVLAPELNHVICDKLRETGLHLPDDVQVALAAWTRFYEGNSR
ncbi:SART-1 family protein DOT2 [Diplonema papillatum]|nr:SART-1 family protein DOT2 [Diplonema papillatum]